MSTDAPDHDASTGDGPARGKSTPSAKTPTPVTPGGTVPNKASEDDPRAWGDRESDNDHDAWLKEQKPPHWG